AFPCISTGIYGFPNEPAAVIALSTIKEWLAKNQHEIFKPEGRDSENKYIIRHVSWLRVFSW
ncbi:unnamed protein product, partial [Rangifer tarandus platyrhynchus]